MALWKPLRGNRTALDTVEKHDGWIYFCTDDGSLFFDYTDADGNLQRKQLNAKDAETIAGVSLDELKVFISNQDAVVLAEAQQSVASEKERAESAELALGSRIDALEESKPSTSTADAIVDVLELPTDNINKNTFYRLMTAKFVVDQEEVGGQSCVYCVDTLPEMGEVVSDFTLSYFIAYYFVPENTVYGYVDSSLGSAFGISAGWYSFEMLSQVAGHSFNGIITNIEDNPSNGYFAILLEYDYYLYQDGWHIVPLTTDYLDVAVNDALTEAILSGDLKGEKGDDGISATHSWSGTTLTITSASGTSSANLKGDPGTNGTDGVGVSSIQQTTTSTADDGNNVITVTLTNGTTSTFTVQNGSKGSAGSKGDKGDAGYTPIRGTDYWTDADKAEIKAYVDEAILNGAW